MRQGELPIALAVLGHQYQHVIKPDLDHLGALHPKCNVANRLHCQRRERLAVNSLRRTLFTGQASNCAARRSHLFCPALALIDLADCMRVHCIYPTHDE